MPESVPSSATPTNDVPTLIQSARRGSSDALGQLLEWSRQYLLLVANEELESDLRVKGGASDLVQETFLEAQQKFAQFRGHTQADLLAWLRQALLNNLADFKRRYQETNKRDIGREICLDADDSSRDLKARLVAQEPSPSDLCIQREQAEALHAALGRLPEHYRQVIVLRHRERCSFEEIGHRIDRSAEAARKLWARAVRQLREELGPEL